MAPLLLEAGQFDLKAEIFKAESWISGQPVAWPFHPFFFFSLTVCVDGGGGGFRKRRAKPDQHQQTKESLLGINEIVVPVG